MKHRKETKLHKFQIEGVLKLDEWGGRAIVGDELGLGKTVQSLMWMKHYLPRGPSIIVVPAHLKGHWKKQAKLHVGLKVKVLSGMTPPRKGPKRRNKDIYIVSYNCLGDPRKANGTWLCWLRKVKARLVIMDEGHYVCNPDSQRSKASRELCRIADHVIVLTGTPITNSPHELWPLLNCVDPVKYSSFYAFRAKYCEVEMTPWGAKVVGAKNLDVLHRKLKRTILIRRLKKDVLKDLPPIQHTVVPLELSKENRKEYEEAKTNFLKWLAKISRVRALKASKSEQMSKFNELKRLAGRSKLDKVIEWIEDFLRESDEKLIVFGIHKKVLHPLYEHFKKMAVLVTGETPLKDRDRLINRFLRKAKRRLFFGNLRAAGTGWSAKGVTNVANVELDWSRSIHAQAAGRCHGLGRGKKGVRVNNYFLVAEDTIEEDLCRMHDRKQSYSDEALDGVQSVEGFDMFEELKDSLTKGKKWFASPSAARSPSPTPSRVSTTGHSGRTHVQRTIPGRPSCTTGGQSTGKSGARCVSSTNTSTSSKSLITGGGTRWRG